jgi:hypothetical protein
MDCPNCGTETVCLGLSPAERSLLPDEPSAVALCPRCLSMRPASEPDTDPEFGRVSDAVPTDPDVAVPMLVLVGLLDSLATNRSAIATLLERVERAGTDPLLVLDRLAADPSVDADVDLAGRRRQLEQLL